LSYGTFTREEISKVGERRENITTTYKKVFHASREHALFFFSMIVKVNGTMEHWNNHHKK